MSGRHWRRGARLAAALAILLLALWLGGFLWFLHLVPTSAADADSPTDAIVVLTGGSLRVETGLRLLAAGKAKKLFVSGVYHGVDVGELLRVSRQAPEQAQCCIVLGHSAESTEGNARETASFMADEHYGSLRLVTASYHMPRSLLEFARAMPQIRIVPYPVFPDIVAQWWRRPAGIELFAEEYVKYLGALAHPFIPFVR